MGTFFKKRIVEIMKTTMITPTKRHFMQLQRSTSFRYKKALLVATAGIINIRTNLVSTKYYKNDKSF